MEYLGLSCSCLKIEILNGFVYIWNSQLHTKIKIRIELYIL